MSAPTKRKPGRPAPSPPPPVDPGPCDLRPAAMAADDLVSLKDAARRLGGVHVNTVRRLIRAKVLPIRRVGLGRGRIMVPLAALRLYIGTASI